MEEERYEDVLKGIIEIIKNTEHSDIGFASICTYIGDHCPELESEDEKVRKQLLDFVHRNALASYSDRDKWVAWLEKLGKQREQLINKACDVLVNCIEDYMLRRMEVWGKESKKQTLEKIRKKLKEVLWQE